MITITRRLAIINGFVEIPNTKIESKTAVTPSEAISAVPVAVREYINGAELRNMRFIKFPEVDARSYPPDWYATLRAIA
jgi:hypothetical protein